jgi:hemolysin activation/secretion protein
MNRRKRIEMQKLIKILFSYSVICSVSLAYANDPVIPKVDDMNKQVPKVNKNLQKKEVPSDKLFEKKTDQSTEKEGDLVKVFVKEFTFEGNKKYPTSEFLKLVENKINKELNYADLRNILQDVSFYYRSKGYLATAFLPEQDITDGKVQIFIVEGRIGKVEIKADAKKQLNISKERISKYIFNKVKINEILNIVQLDRNIRNLNNIPGINAIAQLVEGDQLGETDVIISASNTKTLSTTSLLDNNGSRSSGYERLTNILNFDSAFNKGERFSITDVVSEGSHYYAGSLAMPVGYNGLTTTLRMSKMEYDLGAPFASTKPTGYSTEFFLGFNKELIVKPDKGLTSSLSFSRNDYVNNLNTGSNSNKDIIKTSSNLTFNNQDKFFSGGSNTVSLTGIYGTLDLSDNSTNFETDQLTAKSDGEYWKLSLNANRFQRITDSVSAVFKFNGQYTDKNLDGAEQISLGGPTAVRAYPSNEAAGDQGFVTSLEFTKLFTKNKKLTFFYDYGKIQLHKQAWSNWNSTNTSLKNNYDLHGLGFSFSIPIYKNFALSATYAEKLGNNPGKDSSGNDVDGLTWENRSLISIVGQF